MSAFHDKLGSLIPELRDERKLLLDRAGTKVVADVAVRQIVGGMRDLPALVCDTSVVDPDKGLIVRGIPVAHLADKLPEEVFFLLLTGTLPEAAELESLQAELVARASVPDGVWNVIEAMGKRAHPMAILSAALLAAGEDSALRTRYKELPRAELWRAALDDSLTLLARLPSIAAGVYRFRYDKGPRIEPDPSLDWATNFARMLGSDEAKFQNYLRIATVVQSDHEGGHASALACHTVGSVLSDVYYAVTAGWNALAGPLHGLASEVCLEWVLKAIDTYGGPPDDAQIREYAWATIRSGGVVPGYGHAVLRAQDPRYLAILAFGEKNCARDPVFKTVLRMSKVIPSVLLEHGKVKNPWPNVDAINGAVFRHFGFTETAYYTVFFAVALTLGFTAQYVLNRALGTPITRPRSVTTEWLASKSGA